MKTKRIRNYGIAKSVLIPKLYELQGDICPLCKQSMFEEMRKWVSWREEQAKRSHTKGMRNKGKRQLRRKDVNLNIDHIVSVADGGSDDISNLALTHRSCNDIRGSIKIYDARPTRHSKSV